MTTPASDALDGPDASRITAHGTALRLLSYGASLAISVIAIRLLTTHLGTGFGTYTVVSSIAFVAVGSTDAGLWSLGLRQGADATPAERRDLLANLLGLRVVLCLTGVVVGVLFTALTGRAFNLVWGVGVVGIGLTIAMLQQAVSIHLQLELRYAVVAALELVKIVALTATYAVLVALGAGLGPFYFAPAVAGLALVAATALVVPLAYFRPRFHRASWIRMGRAVIPYAVATAVVILYFRVTQIAMAYLATDVETTEYALAFRVVEVLTVIPGLVASSALPLIARARTTGDERLRPLASSLAQTALLAGLGLAIATAAGAPIAIRVIGGGADSPSIGVLQILAIALAFTFPLAIWSFLLLAIEQLRAISISGGLAAGVALALALALIPAYGATGGAIATVGAEIVLAGALLVGIARHDSALVPSPTRFLRPLLAAIPAAAVIILTRNAGPLAPLIAIPVFALSALLLRAVPAEIWDVARVRRA
ncbi:MAG TPA: polysaccharide biosynthesis C-terminal domain-containing protein [Gaiellales bacterium]|jgi:O-antigen/teichoic acid export membrane protein|nr:polysaccharide biosynthesis C-terminal domain-containing protein [Gaiellales bacterium]